ncbi:hypothetical protein CLOM_g12843 [Closterium sp. NIES-68]|nr:hypothetical protein CLOM_g12392 [Closterium sp. NIES-68]GJP53687.1 hypothetical protein CLOM_g12843 [Closterium sp. NIES-68]GJP66931.1 hypothetical protein CLOP_g23800 [Closterium sp. NIES-67]GJP82847.1 hypothetical protein CLOP_g13074 [Closterium sp. NIES-67]
MAAACSLTSATRPLSSVAWLGGISDGRRFQPTSSVSSVKLHAAPSAKSLRARSHADHVDISALSEAVSTNNDFALELIAGNQSRRAVLLGAATTAAAATVAAAMPWVLPREALAVVTVGLKDLTYRPCAQPYTVGPGSSLYKAKCFKIIGTTVNKSGRTVYNADVFGFVLDAYDEPALPNRGRLASIKEIPVGEGTFEIEIVVPASESLPLTLKNFRATGFHGGVQRTGNPYDVFEEDKKGDDDDIPF